MVKNPPANAGAVGDGFKPWFGKIPKVGKGNPLQYSCLEIPQTEEPGLYSPWGPKESDMTE